MGRIWSDGLGAHVGERVEIAGWLQHQRQLAKVSFALVRDARGIAQVVVEDAALRTQVAALGAETVLKVEGTVVADAQAPGGLELHQPAVTVITAPTSPPPFELRRPQLDIQLPTLLDYAALAWRHPRQRAVGNLAAASVAGFRRHLDGLGFVEIQTPKLVASATEGGANVFRVDYFGRDAYLAQSPQFYKQAMVGVHERVYEVGPVFRAEPHDTARHLAEYVSLDLEMGFIEDHRDVMGVLRGVLAEMVRAIQERAAAAVQLLELALPEVPLQIPAIDFWDAQDLVERISGEPTVGELDLAPAHERLLGDWAISEHGSEFLFVVGYPMAKRPFYTHPNPQRPEFSNSFDLLFRGLELVTGGQRLHRYPDYLSALAGQDLAPYDGYLQAFQYGMPPHGGFALGLERWLARLTGASNVRAVTLFPRDLNRLSP
jgi:nondiscriminating aspartyl-tRNA synthetase